MCCEIASSKQSSSQIRIYHVILIACQTLVSEMRMRVISGFVQQTDEDSFQGTKFLEYSWTQVDNINTFTNRNFFFYLGITVYQTYCHPEVTRVNFFLNDP